MVKMKKAVLLDTGDCAKLTASLAEKLGLKNPAMSCEEAVNEFCGQSDDFVVTYHGDDYLDSDDVFCVLQLMYKKADEKKVDELVPVLIKELFE